MVDAVVINGIVISHRTMILKPVPEYRTNACNHCAGATVDDISTIVDLKTCINGHRSIEL